MMIQSQSKRGKAPQTNPWAGYEELEWELGEQVLATGPCPSPPPHEYLSSYCWRQLSGSN